MTTESGHDRPGGAPGPWTIDHDTIREAMTGHAIARLLLPDDSETDWPLHPAEEPTADDRRAADNGYLIAAAWTLPALVEAARAVLRDLVDADLMDADLIGASATALTSALLASETALRAGGK